MNEWNTQEFNVSILDNIDYLLKLQDSKKISDEVMNRIDDLNSKCVILHLNLHHLIYLSNKLLLKK